MESGIWIIYSFLVTLFTSGIVIIYKIFTKSKYDILILISISFILLGLSGLTNLIYNKNKFLKFYKQYDYKIVALILFYVLLTILIKFNIQKAIKLSPSIGLCHLIINTNVIFTFFIGYFLFGQTINKITILGILVTLIGLFIVLYGSKQEII
jgi:drug/metabolite transporter (DMT)-like permease